MNLYLPIDFLAAVAGLLLTAVLCRSPRFGPTSWILGLFLIPGSLSVILIQMASLGGLRAERWAFGSFVLMVICAAGGCVASYTIQREDYVEQLRKKRWILAAIVIATPIILVELSLFSDSFDHSAGTLALGRLGYYAAVYMVLLAVLALANVEQTLRSAEEYARWEIKFLLLGIASPFTAILYVATTMLLRPPDFALLSVDTLHLFPIVFLFSCCLIFLSWRRTTAGNRVTVSQGVIYSTITFLGVGAYLIASSLVSRWAKWAQEGIPAEALFFIVSLLMLSTVLLATTFRHRVRRWIRRNVFAGSYDYRQVWMDATEQASSIDSAAVAADAFADVLQKTLGSLDITVWVRERNSDGMTLMTARGTVSDELPRHLDALAEVMDGSTEPVSSAEVRAGNRHPWMTDFLAQTKASLMVPLISSRRLVGVATVGADRSGKHFDWETREFLRVLGVHFANEFHKVELLSAMIEAREAQAFQTFSTFLLHDLKNFASTLSLVAKNATRHHGNVDFRLDAFQSIYETSEKMKQLCNSLRTFSISQVPNKKHEDLTEIVRSVAATFETSLSRPLKLNLGTSTRVPVDKDEIKRVLQNLILNAHEASPEGSAITITTQLESRGVVIAVNNRGAVASKEFLQKALQQPFQTTKPDGLGIGLFQSKKIVDAHNGTIEVDATAAEGITVRIILPVEDAALPQQPLINVHKVGTV